MKQSQEKGLQSHRHAKWTTFVRWFDSWTGIDAAAETQPPRVDWARVVPFIFMHLMCLGVLWVSWSWTALLVAIGLYLIRMFAITAFYHRYFSHRTFKTSRRSQFVFAILGSTVIQRGHYGGRRIIVIITAIPTTRPIVILPSNMVFSLVG